jgi:uncharacterized membrane protein YfcA
VPADPVLERVVDLDTTNPQYIPFLSGEPQLIRLLFAVSVALAGLAPDAMAALHGSESAVQAGAGYAWWVWALALFALTFVLGIAAVLAGVGGGVLFVPIVSGLFPFHLDFVRSAGLLLALAGALSAGPSLLAKGFASLRLALPFALVGSVFSVIGALLSFSIPDRVMQIMLGATILGIAALMLRQGNGGVKPARSDTMAAMLGLTGAYFDPATGQQVQWQAHRTVAGFAAFAVIGLVGGLFGLGAGWANVPALNLLLGVPVKSAVATSTIVMSIVNTSAAWIYIERGAVLAIVTVPSIIGVMLGASVGARLLHRMPAAALHRFVIAILLLAGVRAMTKGLGIW